jgi:dTDP-4-amino-4,6-dideoxygalactose transaminase
MVRLRRAHVPNPTITGRELARAVVLPAGCERAETRLAASLGVEHVVTFASARGALTAALSVVGRPGPVAMSGYTCVAVLNSVHSAGRSARFIDVDDRGLVPAASWPEDAAVVIAQDTYGYECELPPHALIVRDASHRVDLLRRPGAVISVTSFEQSKWLSAGQGGLAATTDARVADALRASRDQQPPTGRSVRHAAYTVVTTVMGRASYGGRLAVSRRLRRVARRLDPDRLRGQSDAERNGLGVDPRLLGRPNRLSLQLMLSQCARIDSVRAHRAKIVAIYDARAELQRLAEPLVRYPLVCADPLVFEARMREHGWDVSGRWFSSPLHGAVPELGLGVGTGETPSSERLAASVVNLPTHPLVSERDADALVLAALSAGAKPLCTGPRPDDRVSVVS